MTLTAQAPLAKNEPRSTFVVFTTVDGKPVKIERIPAKDELALFALAGGHLESEPPQFD